MIFVAKTAAPLTYLYCLVASARTPRLAGVPVGHVPEQWTLPLGAIAEERPDVVVLELGMGGSMAGKDVVNVIKATMEWVDIPIVLYTQSSIRSGMTPTSCAPTAGFG